MDSSANDIFTVDPQTTWLDTVAFGNFRIWHVIAVGIGILLSIVIIVCCCIRFRIPRTKQEIEADYHRKQITKKFREKLQQIKNSEMDDMDLQKAIARIQSEFHQSDNISNQSKRDIGNEIERS